MKIGIFTKTACIDYLASNKYHQQLPKEKQVAVTNACLNIIEKLPDYEFNRHSSIINENSLHYIDNFRNMFNDFCKGLK